MALVFDLIKLFAERSLLRRELLCVHGIQINRRALSYHHEIIGGDARLLVGHVELRHPKSKGRTQRLRILEEVDRPAALRPAPLEGEVRSQSPAITTEPVAHIAFV